ncbi:hypothetical protein [Herbiconiux daphne]|uniref:Uncharacterized protein n=1 Tax=Herbiconiux daphne TaxID=2970914 RepID=A0ABT2GY78_9MICO|nr:hypothetical protein [Herbiconiux daphne]MCS5732868.1 hypothetical protein [Herbiconiux daphne]
MLYEDGREAFELTAIDELLQDALISSGLAYAVGDELRWAIADARPRLRAALGDVIAGMRRPQPDFPQISESCWTIERLVKQALRARAKALWGAAWGSELLGSTQSMTALTRARNASYAAAISLVDLRDPLEWLSLAEVLELRTASGVGTLGISEAMWAKLRIELLPVKDRIERSQLMRKQDVDLTRRWVSLLSTRLSTSGSRSMEESIASSVLPQREVVGRIRDELSDNPRFHGDVAKDLMSLVVATVRFLAHVLEERPYYAAAFSTRNDAPLERDLQDAFKAYLDMSDLAGRSAVEVSSIGGGRADVVLYFGDGTRYVTEVKRKFKHTTRPELEAAYLPQTVAYQLANVPFSQLLVLDLSDGRDVQLEHLDESIWVTHSRDSLGAVVASSVVAVVRANRPSPSRRQS